MNTTLDLTLATHTSSNHYRIRREIVWSIIAASIAFAGYMVSDWWSHMNWPPHGANNKTYVKKINCEWTPYFLYNKDISSVKAIGGDSNAIDRQIFFEHPECAAVNYLSFEGTGIRTTSFIYDRKSKRRTAVIVTTFDKHEGE